MHNLSNASKARNAKHKEKYGCNSCQRMLHAHTQLHTHTERKKIHSTSFFGSNCSTVNKIVLQSLAVLKTLAPLELVRL